MIFQRTLRPQGSLRAVASSLNGTAARFQARRIHHVPQLTHDATFKKEGVPDLLSADGFDLAWTQYQGRMVEKLNSLTAGTPDENDTPGTLLIRYARQASMASLFNYASMSHNNHFFFNCISPQPVAIPAAFEKEINESCSSVESLRAEFLATADAMFGPGFVWLVKAKDTGLLHILTTYNAGSPYPQAHFRQQPVDMATATTNVTGGGNAESIARMRTSGTAGFMGPSSSQKVLGPGGVDIQPVLCVNTWEHVWLRDWGINGKAAFLEAWWNKINWEEVVNNFNTAGGMKSGKQQKTLVSAQSLMRF